MCSWFLHHSQTSIASLLRSLSPSSAPVLPASTSASKHPTMSSPSATLQKFGAPDPGQTISDASGHWKLAQRVEQTMLRAINSEPKQLDPRSLLVAPANRDGAPPNVQYIHYGILRSLQKSGFDRTRPHVGICVQFRSSEGKERLLAYNKSFSSGNSLLPPIDEPKVLYGTLAGSHLNLALRIIQAGTHSPAADVAKLVSPGSHLAEIVEAGHKWWILPEDTPVASQIEVSLWRNMDQNENQSLHEIEILRNIIATCQEVSKIRSQLAVGDIVARAQRRSPHKVSERALQSLTLFYLRHLEDKQPHLAIELQEFHSAKVNPRELQMSAAFFFAVANEKELKGCPLLRHYLITTNYTPEKSKASVGQADVCNFLESSAIPNLAKKPDLIKQLEGLLRHARDEYIPLLEKEMSSSGARLELLELADMWIRCAFARPLKASNSNHSKTSISGKFSDARARQLSIMWASNIDGRFPDLQFSQVTNLQADPADIKRPSDPVLDKTVDIEGLLGSDGALHPGDVSEQVPGPPEFASGDKVAMMTRMTVKIPLPGNPLYRKDIERGTVGIVQEYADPEHRQVLVRFEVKVPAEQGPELRTQTSKVFVRHLIKEDQWDSGLQEPQEAGSSNDPVVAKTPKPDQRFSFLTEGYPEDEVTEVHPEIEWDKLQDTTSVLQSLWLLKGKAAILSSAVLEAIRELGPEDLMVVHRKVSGKLSWRTEVWTMRRFSAKELVIPILSSEVKDCFYTKNLHAFISLPQHGPGRHPEGKQLAFDGRGRSRLASAGILDDQEHRGLLCWAIERDSGDSCNLLVDQVSADVLVDLKLPGSKKRRINFGSDDLPSIPVLINPQAIPKHTRLFVRAL